MAELDHWLVFTVSVLTAVLVTLTIALVWLTVVLVNISDEQAAVETAACDGVRDRWEENQEIVESTQELLQPGD